MQKGEKMSEEQRKKISDSNKATHKKIGKPYYQAFGNDNPACRKEVRDRIANTVKSLWEKGVYKTRINGMTNRKGFDHPNYSPESEMKFRYKKYLSKIQDVSKCSHCGKTNAKIDVHHIDEHHDNWLITNLEPLCVQCHKFFHIRYYVQPYVTIGKIFDMECCHQLNLYPGKCQRYHGHTYQMEIRIRKRIHPQTGMVMDYGVLKDVVNEFVIEKLDHFDLNKKIPFQTTAENMIFWIWKQLEEKALLKGLVKISLKETKNSIAVLTWQDVLEYEKQMLYFDEQGKNRKIVEDTDEN